MNKTTRLILICLACSAAAISCGQKTTYRNGSFTWQNDTISLNDGSVRAYAADATTIISNYPDAEFGDGRWQLSRDISHLPAYEAPTRIEEALYNLSLEESVIAVEPDSTLRTGKNWSGVWTRDVSYSIILALSHIQPQASMKSLVRKVDRLGRIIQDTGTGGSWPCSTDRTVWVIAAWELYKVTGDRNWLEYIYPIIKRSIEDDLKAILDTETGLMKGESSYLDWREQEYPRWMTPVDIYNSENLGTECVHYQALTILSELEKTMGNEEDALRYAGYAEQIKDGINRHLWMEDKGFYAQYLYGRQNLIASPRSETLGEALAVLYGIASDPQAKRICSNVPCQDFGTACFFPNIADMGPYHNDAMWPFVQGYWMNACKKAHNSAGVMHSIAAIYRCASFFLTNKENMVIYNGNWQGTAINSSRQLWSIAGNLSIVNSVLFGMEWETDCLRFAPFVPKEMAGTRKLGGFRYRNGIYDIQLEGYGDGIKSFYIDGKESDAVIPASEANGRHSIRIVLNGHIPASSINMVENAYSPLTPQCRIENGRLLWESVPETEYYTIIRNGERITETVESGYELDGEGEYQVIANGTDGYESFASEPVNHYTGVTVLDLEDCSVLETSPYRDFEGKGYIDLTTGTNTDIAFDIEIADNGLYAIDFLYANANGSITSENRCAVRTLFIDGQRAGTVVMSQWGFDSWNIWRYSNIIKADLSRGSHRLALRLLPENTNMNIDTNSCALDCIRLTRLP